MTKLRVVTASEIQKREGNDDFPECPPYMARSFAESMAVELGEATGDEKGLLTAVAFTSYADGANIDWRTMWSQFIRDWYVDNTFSCERTSNSDPSATCAWQVAQMSIMAVNADPLPCKPCTEVLLAGHTLLRLEVLSRNGRG